MSFFRRGIHMLPEKWEKIVSSDGQYFNWNVFVPYIWNKVFILYKNSENLFKDPLYYLIFILSIETHVSLECAFKIGYYILHVCTFVLTKEKQYPTDPYTCFTVTSSDIRWKNREDLVQRSCSKCPPADATNSPSPTTSKSNRKCAQNNRGTRTQNVKHDKWMS